MARNIYPNPYAKLAHDDWWHPETLEPDEPVLSESQVARFLNDGFLVVRGLWRQELIERAAEEAETLHPEKALLASSKHEIPNGTFSQMPWLQQGNAAPDAALNQMTVDSRVLGVVAQLLGSNPIDLRLSQSHVIAKAGRLVDQPGSEQHGTVTGDQDIHVDYGNNTLLVPPRSGPEAVACLCYYSHVEACGGATHFAKALPGELTHYTSETFNPPNFVAGTKNGSAGSSNGPRSPENTARLYREERPIHYDPGTCVLYRLDAWHRGTPVAVDRVRHTHHHVWRLRHAEWVNWQSLTPKMAGMPTRYLENLSVTQRTVLGFAAPGDAYWTEETLDSVGRRYPGMDMSPYREKLI